MKRSQRDAVAAAKLHKGQQGPSIIEELEDRFRTRCLAMLECEDEAKASKLTSELKGLAYGIALMRYPYRVRNEGVSFVEKVRKARVKKHRAAWLSAEEE